jgi:hypothetical protein
LSSGAGRRILAPVTEEESIVFSRFARRALVVGAAMTAIVIGASGQAQAANAYLILSDRDGRQLGTMTHYDAETDTFKVCDTQRDGHAVTGVLYRVGGSGDLLRISDGSDAGCNSASYDIRSGYTYYMDLSWDGNFDIWHRIQITE